MYLKMGDQRIALILLLVLSFAISTLPLVSAVEDSWTTMEPMPTAERGLGAAVVNGKIYAIGSNVNYEYDPATDTWTTKSSMTTARSGFGIAVYQDRIYVIGGEYGVYPNITVTGINEVYNPATDTWETKTSMPTSRVGAHANAVDGRIYLISGITGGPNSVVTLNEVYDPETDTWTTKEPIPYPVNSYASGSPTPDEVYDQIDDNIEDHSDFSTALYVGHGGPYGFYGYTDYPNDPNTIPDLINYNVIESQLSSSPTFQFAFNWVCFGGNDAPDGAPSAWNPMWWSDPSEYPYTRIGFDTASPWIIDYLSVGNTMKNWLVFFYYHALNSNSIMTSLDYASQYCNFDDFAETPLDQGTYQMYWPWGEEWYSGQMHIEGNVTATYLPTDFWIGGPLG